MSHNLVLPCRLIPGALTMVQGTGGQATKLTGTAEPRVGSSSEEPMRKQSVKNMWHVKHAAQIM